MESLDERCLQRDQRVDRQQFDDHPNCLRACLNILVLVLILILVLDVWFRGEVRARGRAGLKIFAHTRTRVDRMYSTKQAANPWLHINQPRPQARLRLFCFPYAGGAASIYRTWPQYLPNTIEVCAVQLPGRENRFREGLYTNLVELVRMLRLNLLPYLDKPFALFGHSMGALLAYEFAQQLQQHGHRPTHIVVSGRRAPTLPEPESLLHTLASDDEFLAELQRRYNNVPVMVREDPEMRDLFAPLLRADLTLVETYTCTTFTPLRCPLIACGGTSDPRVSLAELQAWQTLTQADFALHRFLGAHFYLNEQVQPLLATIAGYLARPL